MSWDKDPPSENEVKFSTDDWLTDPPSEEEVSIAESADRPWYALEAKNLLPGAMAGLKKIDDFTGAPIRKFVSESVTGKDLANAPTGAEQAKQMGASDVTYRDRFNLPEGFPGKKYIPDLIPNISPADIYGFGLEVVQDPFVIGGALKKGASLLGKGASATGNALKTKQLVNTVQKQSADASAEVASKAAASVSGGGSTLEQGGKLFDFKAPKSLDELRDWKPEPGGGELLGKSRLKQIEQTIPDLNTKPLKYHYDMMENPKAMKALKLQFENLPTADAKKIAAYNQQNVDESGRKVTETINSIAGFEPKNLSDAGDDLINSVKAKYKLEKEMLGPEFEKIKNNARVLDQAETMELAEAIGKDSKVGKIMEFDPETGYGLKRNSPRTGISDAEHGVLSRVVKDLNDGMTFKELQDTRDFLRKSIDPANPGASEEISKVRSILLNQMELMSTKNGPSVGKTFKAYAINERARESIEKVIGGKIESLDAMFAANPERVVQKIFSNPNHAKVVSDYVGADKMNEIVASYINNGTRTAYDSATGFQPTKLRQWLKTNSSFLNNYTSPEVSQRITALADYGYYGKRFLDEVNPSGSAASLKAMIEPQSFFQRVKNDGIQAAVASEVGGRVKSALSQRQATRSLNESLGGVNSSVSSDLGQRISGAADSVAFGANKAIDYQAALAGGRAFDQTAGVARSAESEKQNKNDIVEQVRQNPGLLNEIKNPALRAQIQEQLLKSTQAGGEASSPVRDLDQNLINILGKNPQMIEKIENPKLREALKKHFQDSKNREAQDAFVEGN